MRVYESNTGWPMMIVVGERSERPEVHYDPGVFIHADRRDVAQVLGSRTIDGRRNYQRKREKQNASA